MFQLYQELQEKLCQDQFLLEQSEEKYTFSGKRVKRGLYRTKNNIYVNADVNGAYNILRKEIPEFNCKKLNEGIVDWFLPSKININC